MRRAFRNGGGCDEFFFARLNGGRLREEVFFLAYHLHWSRSEILALDAEERRTYVRMLADRIEAENRAAEAWAEQLRRS
jgi:hypothetical protein